jgi:hypothetical protein
MPGNLQYCGRFHNPQRVEINKTLLSRRQQRAISVLRLLVRPTSPTALHYEHGVIAGMDDEMSLRDSCSLIIKKSTTL